MSNRTVATLGRMAEQYGGLVTTADAEAAGVRRNVLVQLAKDDVLVRIVQGVYRMRGAPELEHELIFAVWLALGGHRRAAGEVPPVVAAGETAAILHDVGDLYPGTIDLITQTRRFTRREGVRLRTRRLSLKEVRHIGGVPALRLELALPDMLSVGVDPSIVADAIAQTLHEGRITDLAMLKSSLNPHARKFGHETGDGAALFEHLLSQGRSHV